MGALLFRTVITTNKAQQNYQMAAIAESAYWTMQDTIHEASARTRNQFRRQGARP